MKPLQAPERQGNCVRNPVEISLQAVPPKHLPPAPGCVLPGLSCCRRSFLRPSHAVHVPFAIHRRMPPCRPHETPSVPYDKRKQTTKSKKNVPLTAIRTLFATSTLVLSEFRNLAPFFDSRYLTSSCVTSPADALKYQRQTRSIDLSKPDHSNRQAVSHRLLSFAAC